MTKYAVVPPTAEQLERFEAQLAKCASYEVAAYAADIPIKIFVRWLRLGRAGDPLFTPITEIIDRQHAELGAKVADIITHEAFEKRNLKALQFLHKNRLMDREKQVREAVLATELVEHEEPVLDQQELDALERALISKTRVHPGVDTEQ